MEKPVTKIPYHLRLLRPFLNLSIQGKFYLLFGAFLAAFTLIGLHNFIFVSGFRQKLLLLKTDANAEQINALISAGQQHYLIQVLLSLGAVIVIGMICFFLVGLLVDLLREMKYRLDMLRMRGEYFPEYQVLTAIPVLTGDEIGKVAVATNDLLLGMRKLSIFRRTIEADESTREVYERLAVIFDQLLHIPYYVIYEIDEEGEHIAPVLVYPKDLEAEICQMTDADICRAKRTGEPVSSIGFPGICPVFPHTDAMTHTCVPMVTGGRILGVVQFLFDYAHSNEREEHIARGLLFARQYLRQALPILRAKRLAESLHAMAITDPLTGLHNRRFLESNINSVLAGVKRRNTQVAILMCDMDFFKQINDEYGHVTGDAVLRSLAQILQHTVREADMVIRYGGEEFLIVLVDCQPGMALKVAEKIRAAVDNHTFTHESISIQKTISIGISEYPRDSGAFWEAVKYADVALYRAKEGGRDKVVRFQPEMWKGENY